LVFKDFLGHQNFLKEFKDKRRNARFSKNIQEIYKTNTGYTTWTVIVRTVWSQKKITKKFTEKLYHKKENRDNCN